MLVAFHSLNDEMACFFLKDLRRNHLPKHSSMKILHLIHSLGNSGAITFIADTLLALQETGKIGDYILE